jgi:U3 small nucleolar RNA-associated protein MPP10
MLDYALDGAEENTQFAIATTNNMEQESPDEDISELSSGDSDGDSETDGEAGGFSNGELSEGVAGLRDESVDEEEGEERPSFTPASLRRKGGHSGLNDDFFDLAEFNVETEEAEAGFVSNGALDADSDSMASDDDNIDYFAAIDGQLQGDYEHGKSVTLSVIVANLNTNPIRIALFRLF